MTFLGIKTFQFNSIFMQTRSKRKTHVVGHLSATALSGRKRAISLTSTHVHVVQNGEPEDAEIALVSTCISQPVPCSTFSNPLCEPCISQDAKVNVMKLERIPPLLKCSNVIFSFPRLSSFSPCSLPGVRPLHPRSKSSSATRHQTPPCCRGWGETPG